MFIARKERVNFSTLHQPTLLDGFMLMFRISLLYHRGAKTNLLILSDVISVQIRLLGIAGVRSLLMARYK